MSIQSKKKPNLRLSILAIWSILLVAVFGFQLSGVVHANGGTVLYVQPSGLDSGGCDSWGNACTLQYALGLAVSGDEIWVSTGTYHPTSGTDRSISFVLISGVGIYGGFNGTESARENRDPSANVTILSGDIGTIGNSADNSYHVVTGSGTDGSAVLDGFTITKGNADFHSGTSAYGGGILIVGGSPTLSNLIITQNTALVNGGGIYNDDGSPSLTDVTISNNTSTDLYGGGMYNSNGVTTLTNVVFSNNTAARGGGMYNIENGDATLTNVIFSNNVADVRGGGMSSSESSPMLTNVTFNDNQARFGGGLHIIYNSSATLTNVTFNGNSAVEDGGGIFIIYSNPDIEHVTVSGNTAGANGGGIYNDNGNPVITNSIVYGNSGTQIYNLSSTPVVTYSIVEGGYAGAGNSSDDPLLDSLQDNGGFTQTMALQAGSPAIDAGDNGACSPTDQRGIIRPQGAVCDIGAYEFDSGPIVTNVSSTTANGAYGAGSVLAVTVTFNEPVIVSGTPQLTLETGTIDRIVDYVSGSGTDTLVFDYTVQAGDTSSDLDYLSSNALALNGGTLRDAVANDAVLTLPAPGATGSLGDNKNIVIDTTAPAVTSVSSTTADGAYGAGSVIAVTVTFNEAVFVSGIPQLTLETGTVDRNAAYVSGSGTDTLLLNYTVQAGDTSSDLDYVSSGALYLNGGTLSDAAANDAVLTLPAPSATGSLGDNKNIVIDTTAPAVTNVSSTTADGAYGAGSVIAVTVTFNEAVIVSGTPQLTLETGTIDRIVDYVSGSGTDTLVFDYTVQAGDTSSDLDYVSSGALALNGGTLRDAGANDAVLTLPAPGATGSLADNKNIEIETVAPDTTIDSAPDDPSFSTDATFTFSSPDVDVVGFLCRLDGGAWSACTSPKDYTGLGAGSHTFEVRAVDAASNEDPVPASFTWEVYIDVTANITVTIGGNLHGPYTLEPGQEKREFYDASGGPVVVESTNGFDLIAAIRLQSMQSGTLLDYNETMGIPEGSLSTKYIFPVYENLWAPLNSQLRFAHLGAGTKTIKVTIGTETWTYDVAEGQDKRIFLDRSGGPVIVESEDGVTQIVAAIRLQAMSNNVLHAYSETFGIPIEDLSTKYYFPVYENKWAPLNSQLRFAHLGAGTKTIKVTIGTETWTYDVAEGQDKRIFLDRSGGPVIIESLDGVTKVIAAIRLQSMQSGTLLDYNETMGIPEGSLSTKYIFPVYENLWAPLNSQLRFAHLGAGTKTIKVTVGTETWTYDVAEGQDKRIFLDRSGGPVIVESLDGVTQIVAAIRLQCMKDGLLNCYSETMGIPFESLSDTYYFPVYENLWAPLNSQVRFGVP
jgi:predicted outer membrane repeat protein